MCYKITSGSLYIEKGASTGIELNVWLICQY